MTNRAARQWMNRLLEQLDERTDPRPFFRQLREAADAAARSPETHGDHLSTLRPWGKLEGFDTSHLSSATTPGLDEPDGHRATPTGWMLAESADREWCDRDATALRVLWLFMQDALDHSDLFVHHERPTMIRATAALGRSLGIEPG